MAGALCFKDHIGVMDELRAKYQRSDDNRKALAAEQMLDDVATMARVREQQVCDAIRGLSLDIAAAQAAASAPEPEGAHAERSHGLLAATSAAEEDLAELMEQDRCGPHLPSSIQPEAQPGERVEDLVTDAEPRTRYELSLYAHISNITWQLERSTSRHERPQTTQSIVACSGRKSEQAFDSRTVDRRLKPSCSPA
ncbi:hypothetical protein WJX81_002792 [Elliptochloris bilobata]|uniref:Uncharacterized protein n=1 Tax=Elliptochloris bilobata TaxID=381761 RepID=A0AAW1S9E7_9CHLO